MEAQEVGGLIPELAADTDDRSFLDPLTEDAIRAR